MSDLPEDIALAILEIGCKGDLTHDAAKRAAQLFAQALHVMPDAEHMLAIDGFDDDPRELWDIPEAREFVRQFAEETTRALPGHTFKDWNINEQSIALIALCTGAGRITEQPKDGKGYRIEINGTR